MNKRTSKQTVEKHAGNGSGDAVATFIEENRLVFRIHEIFKELLPNVIKNRNKISQRFFTNPRAVFETIVINHVQFESALDDIAEGDFRQKVILELTEVVRTHLQFLFQHCQRLKHREIALNERIAQERCLHKDDPGTENSNTSELSTPTRKTFKGKRKISDFDSNNRDHQSNVITTVRLAISLIPGLLSASSQNQKGDKEYTPIVSSIRLENYFNEGSNLPASPYLTRMNVISLLVMLGVLQNASNTEPNGQSQYYHFNKKRGDEVEDEQIVSLVSQLQQDLETAG